MTVQDPFGRACEWLAARPCRTMVVMLLSKPGTAQRWFCRLSGPGERDASGYVLDNGGIAYGETPEAAVAEALTLVKAGAARE